MERKFHVRKHLLNILDHRDKIYYDDFINTSTVCPKILENTHDQINIGKLQLEGISRLLKLEVRIYNKSNETIFEIKINKQIFTHKIQNNLCIYPFQFIIHPKIYDEENAEFEYPLLISIISEAPPNTSWMDIADNIAKCVCEIRCYEIVFDYLLKQYMLSTNIGIDKNLLPRNQIQYGYVLYGNTYIEMYLWTIISKISDE